MSQNETIEFACPSCNQGLKVPAQLAGITGPCPHCQASISAPHPVPAAQAAFQGQPAQQLQPSGLPPERPPGAVPHNQPISSPAQPQPQQRAAPVNMEPAQRQQAHKRKIWPTILFPGLFLVLAAAVVYLVLDLMGILNFREKTPTPDVGSPITKTSPIVSDAGVPVIVDPVEEPTHSPIPVESVTPTPLEHDPQDIKKPGEVPTDLPDLASTEADPTSDEGRNDSIKKRTAAINEARNILKRFLTARTYEERMPLITKSDRTPEELAASCLGKSFPKSTEPAVLTTREREADRSFEIFFSVAFDQADSDRSRIVLVRTITYSEDEAVKIHTDPFIDLFEESVGRFYDQKTEGTATFHSLVKYSAYTYDDIPKPSKMAEVSFYTSQAQTDSSIATAYLSKESKAFKQLAKLAKAGDRIPATVSVAWDTETDPKKPFLQVVRVEAINWAL